MTDNWAMHEAETGLTPPNQNRAQWRDRGARIAQLETELDQARAAIARVKALANEAERLAATYSGCDSTYDLHARLWGDVGRRVRAALAAEPTPAAEPHAQDGECTRCGFAQYKHKPSDGTVRSKFGAVLDNCVGYLRPAPVADPSGNKSRP